MDNTQLLEREWAKVGASLKLCGDIGEFDEGRFTENPELREEELEEFKESLEEFPQSFEEHGYSTLEAMGVYFVLVRLAVGNLGLSGIIAKAFAHGYAFIRTGWALDTDTSIEQNLFYKMFFQSREDHSWEFSSPVVQERLKLVFDKFMEWEQDREHYESEVEIYQEMKQEEAEEAD